MSRPPFYVFPIGGGWGTICPACYDSVADEEGVIYSGDWDRLDCKPVAPETVAARPRGVAVICEVCRVEILPALPLLTPQ
jgi:hypothetical protein